MVNASPLEGAMTDDRRDVNEGNSARAESNGREERNDRDELARRREMTRQAQLTHREREEQWPIG